MDRESSEQTESDPSTSLTVIRTEIHQDQSDMLEALATIPDLRVKNQQRSDSDLTKVEKYDILKSILLSSPMQFLTRFGEHLESHQFSCFDEIAEENDAVASYLPILKKNSSSRVKRLRAKNRRYGALQKLVDTTDYFTEEEMQRRNPILFDQLIGKYHTKAEREAFFARSEKIAASTSTSKTPLTDLLMAHINRNEDGNSYRRLDQEQQKVDEDAADAEYLSNEMDCLDDEDSNHGEEKSNLLADGYEEGEELDDDEKELLKEEFFSTMYRDFLEGKDKDFDYSTVDNNEEYDVGENLEQDEEDAYFEDDEPCELNSDSNSDADRNFRPPVRSKEIESKIESLSVSSSTKITPDNNQDTDESEDDLDAYMRQIESQLQNSR